MNVVGVMAVDDAGDYILQDAPAAEAAASMVLVMMPCMGTDRKRRLDDEVRLFLRVVVAAVVEVVVVMAVLVIESVVAKP